MKVAPTLVLLALFQAIAARGQDAVKTIRNPGGGKIVYGPVAGQTTEAGMGEVLRQIRNTSGDELRVGSFFRVHGTDSMATYFTAVNRNQGNEHMAGFVIVRQVSPGHEEAALLSDDAQRFPTTFNPMFRKLLEVWAPAPQDSAPQGAGSQSAPPSTDSAPVAELQPYTLPDRSASVSLPDGWQVSSASGGGTIIANGPNGEQALLDFPFAVGNTNDPRVRQMMQFAQGAGRNTSYAQSLYYPYGVDMAKTFVDLSDMYREKHGMPAATTQIASESPLAGPPGWRCVHLTGRFDNGDGSGLKEFNSLFCCSPLGRFGGYTTFAYTTTVPVQLAGQERATLEAILSSFSENEQVIAAEGRAIAAPEIARIHEIGQRAEAQANAAHASEDAEAARTESHWDDRDKASKAFSEYQRDEAVVQDNESNTHSTISAQSADDLVRANPQRYEYVPTPDLVKGVDY